MPISVLIADDEPLARKKLRDLCAGHPNMAIVGESIDGPSTVEAIDRLGPDAVFLDLKMPEYDGIEVLRRAGREPAVVFTTAFDQYAVTAFELRAIDYLLKPFDAERFARAVERLAESLARRDGPGALERLGSAPASDVPLDRLFIRHGGRIVVVPVDQIESLEARRDYVAIHVPPSRYLVHLTLNHLERVLPARRFARIHRSHIVNLDRLSELVPCGNGQLEAVLKSGFRVIVSRSRSKGIWELAV